MKRYGPGSKCSPQRRAPPRFSSNWVASYLAKEAVSSVASSSMASSSSMAWFLVLALLAAVTVTTSGAAVSAPTQLALGTSTTCRAPCNAPATEGISLHDCGACVLRAAVVTIEPLWRREILSRKRFWYCVMRC